MDKLEVIWVSIEDELVVGGAVVSLDADSEWLYAVLLEPGTGSGTRLYSENAYLYILFDFNKFLKWEIKSQSFQLRLPFFANLKIKI